ncbi:MAG TPA: DUF1330 domain-containing protein [Sandaracinaceae bacterium LLY-WYZ-13_1]|nr:DUF1330 domain-containing protein [Sandaracinaceae bacterium LLY-WYZ-13_1]
MPLHPTKEQFRAFAAAGRDGPVVMLNLLRFREVADYRDAPTLAGVGPVSGAEAYARYAKAMAPLLAEAGAELVFRGPALPVLVGGADEAWDEVLLVRYPSADAFAKMTSSDAYLAVTGHRTAALADARLIPVAPLAD